MPRKERYQILHPRSHLCFFLIKCYARNVNTELIPFRSQSSDHGTLDIGLLRYKSPVLVIALAFISCTGGNETGLKHESKMFLFLQIELAKINPRT